MLRFISSFLILTRWMTNPSLLFAEAETTLYDEHYLVANGLNFTCTYLQHVSPTAPVDGGGVAKNVVLLHGFPMFRGWWTPLLEYWATKLSGEDSDPTFSTLNAIACDLRGYSPGASPDNIEDYDYSIFAQDTFELATAAGFEGFDLLGHDHGAGLAWFVAGNDPDGRVQSLTAMSVPHTDLFSAALCGDNIDQGQVIASNYFNEFSLPDSATVNNASLTKLFQSFGLDFLEPDQFQKMLWWYNGSLGKHWNIPSVVSDDDVTAWAGQVGEGAFFVEAARNAIPMEERPCMYAPNGTEIGSIEIPTLFVCGDADFALYCNNTYATSYPPELLPNYEHVNFDCGHDFFLEGDCADMEVTESVMDKITMFVLGDLNLSGGTGFATTDPSMASFDDVGSAPAITTFPSVGPATSNEDDDAGSAPSEDQTNSGPTQSDSAVMTDPFRVVTPVVLGMLSPGFWW